MINWGTLHILIFCLIEAYMPGSDSRIAYIIDLRSSCRCTFVGRICMDRSCINKSNLGTQHHEHTPVLLRESIDLLVKDPNDIYLDVTLGSGGHAEEILKRLESKGKLVSIDQDPEAVFHTERRLKRYIDSCRLSLSIGKFGDLQHVLRSKELPLFGYSGIIADLGTSANQLEKPERGFSYMHDGPLDMRMSSPLNDPYKKMEDTDSVSSLESSHTAHKIVNEYSEPVLTTIFRNYGEEPKGRAIAKKIVEERHLPGGISSTGHLREVVMRAVNGCYKTKLKILSRIFQAIRIYVNDELNQLEMFLKIAPKMLKPNGRLVIISYHSLEDRIVKHSFKSLAKGEMITESDAFYKIITKKCINASKEETRTNRRGRSAKLRCIERVRSP